VSYLEAEGLRKHYGHVEALRGADFSISLGEVVALVGDNGAGKSTLVKTLSGAIQPDDGVITVDGQQINFDNPSAARRVGIETVYQDLALADELSPAANLYLGRELRRPGILGHLGFLDDKRMEREAHKLFSSFGVNLAGRGNRLSDLSGGQRQSVAVARAAAWAKKVVFLDEPTAALGVIQTRAVHELIRRVRDQGIGVVLISHNMPEVIEIADQIQVMRFGTRVKVMKSGDATVESLVIAMTSGDVDTHQNGNR